jgi:hypothetical protein
MIEALIAGEPNLLSSRSSPVQLKGSPAQLWEPLRGSVTENRCFLLRLYLRQIYALDTVIAASFHLNRYFVIE